MASSVRRFSRALVVTATLALGVGGALAIASPAAAATLTVSSTNANGAGSLQQAILDANAAPGSEITFAIPGAAPWVISVPAADPLPAITESTTISGPGSASLVVHNADATTTAFFADGCSNPVTDVTISGITVDAFAGTGIDIACVNFTATDLRLTANHGSGLSYSSAPGNTADLASITSSDNAAGIYLFADSGVEVTATELSASTNTNDGIDLQASAGGSIDVGSSSASLNGQSGFNLHGTGAGTSVVLHDSAAAHNSDYGVVVGPSNQSRMEVSRNDVSTNDQGNIVGQSSSSVLTLVDNTTNGSPSGQGFGIEAFGGSTLLVTGATASGNGWSGGAVHTVGSTASISGSTFDSNNGTNNEGGGFLLYAESGSAATIDGSTFTNNSANAGGGIAARLDSDSTLDIASSQISQNHAIACGCGDAAGGGLFIAGVNGDNSRFTLTDSQVTGNDTEGDGGGIYFEDLGADTTFGTLGSTGGSTVLRTTIDDNHTLTGGDGGGVYIDNWSWKTDGITDLPAITFDRSTISNNSATVGAGIFANKFVDDNADVGILMLTSTTVANNASAAAGAIAFTSAFDDGRVVLSHSTVAANTGPSFGGVFSAGLGDLQLDHALLAENENGDLVSVGGAFASAWSLVEDDLGSVVTGPNNVVGVDPSLAPLALNGGSTKTMLIAPGSAAYNAGDPAFVGAGLFDQRGEDRVFQRVDIGAVEWHPALALTGGAPRPEVPLWGMLFLLVGLALVAASRIRRPV